VGLAPLIGFVGIAASRWFELNDRAPRYLAYPTLLTLLSLAVLVDDLVAAQQPRWMYWFNIAVALGVALLWSAANLRAGDASGAAGARWLARTRWIESVGCQSVIAGYWDSYPYFTLSEGRVLATPCETDYVRSLRLARAAARSPLVCVLPWWPPGDPCPQTLEQFGTSLHFQDELIGHVSIGPQPDEQPLRVCRYLPAT
jgi:hypothetical protein